MILAVSASIYEVHPACWLVLWTLLLVAVGLCWLLVCVCSSGMRMEACCGCAQAIQWHPSLIAADRPHTPTSRMPARIQYTPHAHPLAPLL